MTSVPPPGGGSKPPDFGSGLPPEMGTTGPLLPAGSPFVQAVTKMFSTIGMGGNIAQMQQVATKLLESMQKALVNQIKHESALSRERRKQDLRELLGEE